MKKIFLFGNWKMNQSLHATKNFAAESAAVLSEQPGLKAETEICIFPPFVLIPEAVKDFTNCGVEVGAQNASDHGEGAYTGEVAPSMLKEAGCRYVLVGHSERRHIYGESSELVNKKALNCLASALIPVLCVGETLEQRDAGRTAAVISDLIARECDFLSIGSNDLIQYTMAVDRLAAALSYLYSPFSPSVLRLVQTTIKNAATAGKPVSLCGEMAGDPLLSPILFGMGLRSFSVNPFEMLRTQWILSLLKTEEMRACADEVLNLATAEEIHRYCREHFSRFVSGDYVPTEQ